MTTIAIIQARMASTRLPGKVLADIAGTPLLRRVIDRVNAATSIERVVVATTTDSADDELAAFVERETGCDCFRGERDDVLDRFYNCTARYEPAVIVRITADDPLKDPRIVDRAVQVLRDDTAIDYCSNTLNPTYPEGLDVEVFRASALAKAHSEARLPSEREHVTPYIWKHPDRFRIAEFRHNRDLSAWRWTVDRPNDLEFMQAVFGHFAASPLVSYLDVIEWLEEHPEVREINAAIPRNEGYLKSLESEQPT